MHALEAAAMDDPFLADALEGFNTVNPATIPADVQELRARLNERSGDKKVVPLARNNKWWRVAAMLIFLGGASLLTYKLLQQNNENKLAKQETISPNANSNAAPVLPADTLTATAGSNAQRMTIHDSTTAHGNAKQFHANTQEQKLSANQQGAASAITKPKAPASVPDLSAYKKTDTFQDDAFAAIKEEASKDSVFVAGNDASKNARLQGRVPGIATQNPQQANNRANADMSNQLYFNNFSGRVVDAQNNAIPYANVRVNNNNQVAATNNEGYFQIRSADTVIDLSVTSAGYQPRNLTLRGNQPTQEVALERYDGKGKMSEVVVTSGAIRKKSGAYKDKEEEKPSNFNTSAMAAQPVTGWDEFNRYLEENRRVDDANKALKGEVVVTFRVNSAGLISDVAIEKSLSRWHDAEALRLLKEGPAWKPVKGKQARVRVIVGF